MFLLNCFCFTAEKGGEKIEGVKYLDILGIWILFASEMWQNSWAVISMCFRFEATNLQLCDFLQLLNDDAR